MKNNPWAGFAAFWSLTGGKCMEAPWMKGCPNSDKYAVKKSKKSYQIKAQDTKIQIFLKPAISRLNRHTNIANTFIAPNQSIPTLVSSKNEEKKRHGSTEVKINYQEMKDKNPKVYEEYFKINEDLRKDINLGKSSPDEKK